MTLFPNCFIDSKFHSILTHPSCEMSSLHDSVTSRVQYQSTLAKIIRNKTFAKRWKGTHRTKAMVGQHASKRTDPCKARKHRSKSCPAGLWAATGRDQRQLFSVLLSLSFEPRIPMRVWLTPPGCLSSSYPWTGPGVGVEVFVIDRSPRRLSVKENRGIKNQEVLWVLGTQTQVSVVVDLMCPWSKKPNLYYQKHSKECTIETTLKKWPKICRALHKWTL